MYVRVFVLTIIHTRVHIWTNTRQFTELLLLFIYVYIFID